MAETNKCLICGGVSLSEYLTATDFLVSGEEFLLLKCPDCGFIFTANPPDEMEIGQYYLSEDYISHTDKKSNITEVLYHLIRRFMLRKKFNLITSVCHKTSGALLDIGSGTGYFAGYMKEKRWDVRGIEISERARNYSFSKFGIDVLSPDKIVNLPDRSFDCVTLWHVIEHFNNPEFWLSEIFRIMKDDGICVMAMPNISSSDSKWFGKCWAALDVPRHLWHFSPDTFNKMIQKANFRCTHIKGMPFDLFYISILSYRNQKTKMAFLRGMCTGLILSIKNLFVRYSASSLVYVIEKNRC